MRSSGSGLAAAAAGRSHQLATRVDVLFNREVVVEDLAVLAGNISYDRTAQHLARCNVNIADPTRLPLSSADILTPFGYEVQLWRGVPDDMVPLGVFPIQSSQADGRTLLTSVAGIDRSKTISDAAFEDDYAVAAGTNYATAIEDLIAAGVDNLTYNLAAVTETTPALVFSAQTDRWKAAQQMAKSIGHEIYLDGNGTVTMRPEPEWSGDPVTTIAEGSNLTDIDVALDRLTAYNKVVAIGRNATNGDQFRGEASDDNPSSPSYYGGPFGRKPRFYFSEFLASDAQCDTAAAAILRSQLGVAKTLKVGAVPDPRLETSDVIQVSRPLLNIDELHIIDKITLGLAANSAMTIGTRAQTATA